MLVCRRSVNGVEMGCDYLLGLLLSCTKEDGRLRPVIKCKTASEDRALQDGRYLHAERPAKIRTLDGKCRPDDPHGSGVLPVYISTPYKRLPDMLFLSRFTVVP